MKRIIQYFVLILVSFSCKEYKVIYSDLEPNESDLALIEIQLSDNKNLLTFVKEFNNTQITLTVDGETIFTDNISTDPSLGAAKGLEFPRSSKTLSLTVDNSTSIEIKNETNYRFIYIYKENTEYRVEYSKKPLRFY